MSNEKDFGGKSRYIATHLQELQETSMPEGFGYIEPPIEESHEFGFACESKKTFVRHDKAILEALEVIYKRGEETGHTTSAIQAHKLLCNATLEDGITRKFERKKIPEPSQIKSVFGRMHAKQEAKKSKKGGEDDEPSEANIEESANDIELKNAHIATAIAVKKVVASQDDQKDRVSQHPFIVCI